MSHLSDEQLEAVLAGEVGEVAEGEHLLGCNHCRARLAERRAVRSRLRSAFNSVRPGEGFSERLARRLDRSGRPSQAAKVIPLPRMGRLRRALWPALAAAAMLAIAVGAGIYLFPPDIASAAEAELFNLHRHSLSDHAELYASSDPEALARHFKERLGFSVALPRLGAGMSLRGCCVAHFR
ncbi:hypothetical protein LCGC14_1875640, partial [marine sediment metagenome]